LRSAAFDGEGEAGTCLMIAKHKDSLLRTRDRVIQSDAALNQDIVGLYKALGGGWDDRSN